MWIYELQKRVESLLKLKIMLTLDWEPAALDLLVWLIGMTSPQYQDLENMIMN